MKKKRKNRKIRLEANNQLFETISVIIEVLYANIGKKISVNVLLKKALENPENEKLTGLKNKYYYLSVKNFLIENKIIDSKKKDDLKKKNQRQYLTVTDLGIEIKTLVENMKKFNTAYFNFVAILYSKVYCSNEKFLSLYEKKIKPDNNHIFSASHKKINEYNNEFRDDRLKLINEGWKEPYLTFYTQIRSNMLEFKILCDKYYFTLFLVNYANIDSNHKTTNDKLKKYIQFEIFKIINDKIRFLIKNYRHEILGFNNISFEKNQTLLNEYPDMKFTVSQGVYRMFFDLFDLFYPKPLFYRMKKEIHDLVIEFLNLFEISEKDIEIFIIHLNRSEHRIKWMGKNDDQYSKLVLESIDLFKDIMYSYFLKKGKKVEDINLYLKRLNRPRKNTRIKRETKSSYTILNSTNLVYYLSRYTSQQLV